MLRHYALNDEAGRLWTTARGALTRLRTWDIFSRFLPGGGRVADVGGGPGTHASHLAGLGYEVTLVDPVPKHIEQASAAADHGAGFACLLGDARRLPLPDASFDVVLLMGPLYHLADAADRQVALREAYRVLRPGGRLLAEVISRYAWIIDATAQGLLGQEGVWDTFDLNLRTGHSNTPDRPDEVFWAYFHRVEEVGPEVERAGFSNERLLAVEGFAGSVGNLAELLREPEQLMRVIRLTEGEPSMLGISAHLMAVASKPGPPR
ncbi:class I SAM-dependent methyltransferase [Nonomuraea jiangxiensis]|uniref:class I SAM-dependent methyltransferase n=1 Tax=Nonomuraea jiangxiensis TaxID=633440 RepID=UPI000B893F7C|nr:class I SAM-dependent methyltransferase [Nonomuraea jiangxiensis]